MSNETPILFSFKVSAGVAQKHDSTLYCAALKAELWGHNNIEFLPFRVRILMPFSPACQKSYIRARPNVCH